MATRLRAVLIQIAKILHSMFVFAEGMNERKKRLMFVCTVIALAFGPLALLINTIVTNLG